MNSIREYCEQQTNADTTGEHGSDDYHRGKRAAFRQVMTQIDIMQDHERLKEWAERHRTTLVPRTPGRN